MFAHYRVDPGESRFRVQAFAGGLLSFMAHSPTFTVRDYGGQISLDSDSRTDAGVEITIRADSLELVDNVRPADRAEIEDRMRREVLDITAHPEIRFEARDVPLGAGDGNRHRARIAGRLSLRGVTQPVAADAELTVYPDGVRLIGECPLPLAAFHIRPVTALGGAIKLQDRLRVSFDLVAWKEKT